MMHEENNAVGNSVSPVSQRAPEVSEENKGLVESRELKGEEVLPVPVAEDDEVRQPRVGRRPQAPTKAEIEEHYPLHLNFRSWCEHTRTELSRMIGSGWESPSTLIMHLCRRRKRWRTCSPVW